MTQRSAEDWLALFKQHEESGLSRAQFCLRHKINRNEFEDALHSYPYSYKRKSRTLDEWQEIHLRQLQSHCSVAQFCQENRISKTSFFTSRYRLVKLGKLPDPNRETI